MNSRVLLTCAVHENEKSHYDFIFNGHMDYLSFMYISFNFNFTAYVFSITWIILPLVYLHNNETQMLSD